MSIGPDTIVGAGAVVINNIEANCTVVGVPATIRDNTSGKESAKLFSLIPLIMMIAPSIAPTIGTLILRMAGWQWIFHLTTVLALSVAVLVMLFIPKGKTSDSTELTAVKSNIEKGGLLAVFKEKRALGYMLAQAFAYSVLMTFITNASMIYMTVFDVTPERFSVLFIANICGLITINRLNTLLLRWYEPAQLLKVFLLMQVTGGLILLVASIVTPGNLYIAVTGFVIAIAANGGTMSNASACFLKYHGHNAGSASAVLGAVQYTIGAAVSASAAFISMGRVQPIVIVMLLCALIALTGAVIASRKESKERKDTAKMAAQMPS